MQQFYPGVSLITGNIGSLANNQSLKGFSPYNTQVYGDIASWANNTMIDYFNLANNAQVYGDIANLANCTRLKDLRVNNTNKPGIS